MDRGHYIQIGEQRVGDGYPCFVIAEAGVNHNGSLDMALQLVDAAVAAGADAVKFQKRDLKNLYPSALIDNPNTAEWAFQYMIPYLKQTELLSSDFWKIKQHCNARGIRFMCTPWDETSLELLEDLGIECYKVASADLINLPLLEKIVATGKPLILSTGMATLPEIEQTVTFLKNIGAAFALLHCVSTYPAPFEQLNLRFIDTLKQFNVPVGYSSHERGIAIPLIALSLGSCIIEKHITLDRTLPGPDHPASLEPQGFQKLIRDIRHGELALGCSEKELSSMEIINRQVLRKSLVAAQELEVDTIVTQEMVATKGPGKGLSPQRIKELLGVKLRRSIRKDEYFSESDLKFVNLKSILSTHLHKTWGLKARFHDLEEIQAHKAPLIELHFSEEDVDHPFDPPLQPYNHQLFIHAPEFANHRLLDLCSSDDSVREISINLMQRTIEKARTLQPHFIGGPISIVIHVGGMSMDEAYEPTAKLLERGIQSFRRLDSHGLVLLPENLPPRPWYLGGQWFQHAFIHAEDMVYFCKELGVGMTLDLSHAQLYCNYYGKDLADFVRTCLPYTRHLHIADAKGMDGEGLQIGEGTIDWDTILALLEHADFTWVPEIWSGHLNGGADFIEAINRLTEFDIL